MNAPTPFDFGLRGIAAALQITEPEAHAMYRDGEFGPPDTARLGLPRWEPDSFRRILLKHVAPIYTGIHAAVEVIEALCRAEKAEWPNKGDAQ